ncbi:MAG: hypothetical protein IT422_24190 [Pirellulaceae bacterium]|nr:hypothetical protein [Pirellulaceae bacterium]
MNINKREIATSALIFVSIIALTVVVIVFYPRKYRSTAKLLLKIGRESVTLDPTVTTTGETLSLHHTRTSEINTTLDMMRNRLVLEQVAAKIGNKPILSGYPAGAAPRAKKSSGGLLSSLRGLVQLDDIPEDELVILELESNLSIESASDSGVVKIGYQAKSPELAQQIVQCWVDVYRQLHTKINQTAGASHFFEAEEKVALERLTRTRQALRRAKDDAGLVTVAGQQQMLESRLFAARQAVSTTSSQLAASKSRMEELSKLDRAIPERMLVSESSVGNRAHEQMRQKLYELEIEGERLSGTYTESHPAFQLIRQQQREAKEILANEEGNTLETVQNINLVSQALQIKLNEERADYAALVQMLVTEQAHLEDLQAELLRLNGLEQEIVELEGQVDALATQHRLIVDKLEQSRLADLLEENHITSINTVQPATLEARPATPNKKLCAVLGIFAACCGAIGVPVMRRAARQLAAAPELPLQQVPQSRESRARRAVHSEEMNDEANDEAREVGDFLEVHKRQRPVGLQPR